MVNAKAFSLSNTTQKKESPNTDRLRRLTSYASIFVAGSLIAAKLVAYFMTGSIALLSSLVDSGVDLLASVITAIGVSRALMPADRDHRYGHGKAEALAALAQAAFIIGSSMLLGFEALTRFVKPQQIENLGAGYLVMGFSIIMTIGLLALQSYTVRKTKSMAISADRLHYVGDVLINLAVVLTFIAQGLFNQSWVDPLMALCIAGSLIYSASQIGRKALAVLMDAELPEEDRLAILKLTTETPGVKGAHDLRTRSDSERPIIEIHIEMDGALRLREAHDITEQVMARIQKAYPGADITAHEDPVGVKEKRLDKIIEKNDPLPE